MSTTADDIARELGISRDIAKRIFDTPNAMNRLRDLSRELGQVRPSAEDTNYAACGGNAYQCGKAMETGTIGQPEKPSETGTSGQPDVASMSAALETIKKTLERVK